MCITWRLRKGWMMVVACLLQSQKNKNKNKNNGERRKKKEESAT
jgi:hypothetical protein